MATIRASGQKEINGTSASDLIYGSTRADDIEAGRGNDEVHGRSGNDEIDGGVGNDVLFGEGGHDEIEGGRGKDSITGGSGNDEIDGDADADVLKGGSGNDTIDGGSGNDRLNGQSGNDRLEGDEGRDTLGGGDGADIFVLDERSANRDTILDFKSGTDKIEIEDDDFGGGLREGKLSADRLIESSNPFATVAGKGVFLFDSDNGNLSWDADGKGGNEAVLVGTLSGVNDISANDFLIVG